MPSEHQQIAPDRRQRGKQGCAILAAACAIVIMACVLGSVAVWWRGGELPTLSEHVGPYWIVGHATVAPSCSPVVLCTQQFADVPLPRYYVIWLISERASNQTGTRVLTIPITLPRAR
jgi:hypothetical protein